MTSARLVPCFTFMERPDRRVRQTRLSSAARWHRGFRRAMALRLSSHGSLLERFLYY